ncbi:MAG: FlgD immunoglobulin-like domain containing protein, partial [bacterium]
FMLFARDGQLSGGGGVDRFRIKIWQKDANETVVYDNQMGDLIDGNATDAIEGGSITIHSDGASKASGQEEVASEAIPEHYALEQNYPNPFWSAATSRFAGNPTTEITFALPEAGKVTLRIYSETGQLIRTLIDNEMQAGQRVVSWNGLNESGNTVAAGVYLYRIVVQRQNGETAFTETRRMTLLK